MVLGLILGIGRTFRRKRTSSLDIMTTKKCPRGFYKGKNCKPSGFHTRKGLSQQQRQSVSEILATACAHSETIDALRSDHSEQAESIEQHSDVTFAHKYMDYEPTGSTPIRCETNIPSKSSIELLCAMPM